MIAPAQEKSFNQFGDAGLFCPGKLPPEGKRFLAQMQMDALHAHAHKLAIVGFCVKSRRDCETLKEKLKPHLQTGEWEGRGACFRVAPTSVFGRFGSAENALVLVKHADEIWSGHKVRLDSTCN